MSKNKLQLFEQFAVNVTPYAYPVTRYISFVASTLRNLIHFHGRFTPRALLQNGNKSIVRPLLKSRFVELTFPFKYWETSLYFFSNVFLLAKRWTHQTGMKDFKWASVAFDFMTFCRCEQRGLCAKCDDDCVPHLQFGARPESEPKQPEVRRCERSRSKVLSMEISIFRLSDYHQFHPTSPPSHKSCTWLVEKSTHCARGCAYFRYDQGWQQPCACVPVVNMPAWMCTDFKHRHAFNIFLIFSW